MKAKVPNVTFKTRIRDESIQDENPFRWQDVTSKDIFAGKSIVLFALPGAFTPTCSSTHLPGFERKYEDLKATGVDEVYCLSVNDAFSMFQWGEHLDIKNVRMLPDGNGDFTRLMGMLVKKENTNQPASLTKSSSSFQPQRNPQIPSQTGLDGRCSSDE